jgi:hypothetical protein
MTCHGDASIRLLASSGEMTASDKNEIDPRELVKQAGGLPDGGRRWNAVETSGPANWKLAHPEGMPELDFGGVRLRTNFLQPFRMPSRFTG